MALGGSRAAWSICLMSGPQGNDRQSTKATSRHYFAGTLYPDSILQTSGTRFWHTALRWCCRFATSDPAPCAAGKTYLIIADHAGVLQA